MSKMILRAVPASLGAAACALALSGCPIGGSSSANTSPVTTETAIPDSVASGTTFTVPIALVPGPQYASRGNAVDSRAVELGDVGAASPAIDCGAARYVVVGGAAVDFSCQAPAAAVGGNNQHTLQIQVVGNTDPTEQFAVNVTSAGLVDDVLTDSSGLATYTAAPGDPLAVTFSSTSNPPGVGAYTVSAPAGWQVAGGGVCNIPNGQASNCSVDLTVPASAEIGTTAYIQIASVDGSSPLSNDYLPVEIAPTPSLAAAANPNFKFLYAENIARTLYANLPGSTPTFTYKPVFTFKNFGASITISSVTVKGLSQGSLTYQCGTSSSKTCTLATGETYKVAGTLPNSFNSLPAPPSTVSVAIEDDQQNTYRARETVTFVKYVPDHVAFRVAEPVATPLYVVATVQGKMIQFDQSYVGTVTAATQKYKTYQRQLPSGGGVFYMPYGGSEIIDITRDAHGFSSEYAPTPVGNPRAPPFLTMEPTYATQSCSTTTSGTCERLVVDLTYVDFIANLATLDSMGNASPYALNTQDASFGVVAKGSQSQIFGRIENDFDALGAPWAYDASRGMQNYIQKQNQKTTWVFAPLQVFTPPPPASTSYTPGPYDPMPNDYYTSYVGKLWAYLETTPIYVDASAVKGSSRCILQGKVPTSGTYKGKLVFNVYSGTCPPQALSAGAPFTGNVCGYQKNPDGTYTSANKPCADTPTNLVFAPFNKCDFVTAAAGGYCHKALDPIKGEVYSIDPATFFDNEGLWGPTDTYRAVVGTALAAYQAIGLLPPPAVLPSQSGSVTCPPTQITVLSAANAAADVTSIQTNGRGLTNPPCLSGLTQPVYNVYVDALLPLVNVYTYSFTDFMGKSGTVTFYNGAFPQALAQELPRAQPVTVELH